MNRGEQRAWVLLCQWREANPLVARIDAFAWVDLRDRIAAALEDATWTVRSCDCECGHVASGSGGEDARAVTRAVETG